MRMAKRPKQHTCASQKLESETWLKRISDLRISKRLTLLMKALCVWALFTVGGWIAIPLELVPLFSHCVGLGFYLIIVTQKARWLIPVSLGGFLYLGIVYFTVPPSAWAITTHVLGYAGLVVLVLTHVSLKWVGADLQPQAERLFETLTDSLPSVDVLPTVERVLEYLAPLLRDRLTLERFLDTVSASISGGINGIDVQRVWAYEIMCARLEWLNLGTLVGDSPSIPGTQLHLGKGQLDNGRNAGSDARLERSPVGVRLALGKLLANGIALAADCPGGISSAVGSTAEALLARVLSLYPKRCIEFLVDVLTEAGEDNLGDGEDELCQVAGVDFPPWLARDGDGEVEEALDPPESSRLGENAAYVICRLGHRLQLLSSAVSSHLRVNEMTVHEQLLVEKKARKFAESECAAAKVKAAELQRQLDQLLAIRNPDRTSSQAISRKDSRMTTLLSTQNHPETSQKLPKLTLGQRTLIESNPYHVISPAVSTEGREPTSVSQWPPVSQPAGGETLEKERRGESSAMDCFMDRLQIPVSSDSATLNPWGSYGFMADSLSDKPDFLLGGSHWSREPSQPASLSLLNGQRDRSCTPSIGQRFFFHGMADCAENGTQGLPSGDRGRTLSPSLWSQDVGLPGALEELDHKLHTVLVLLNQQKQAWKIDSLKESWLPGKRLETDKCQRCGNVATVLNVPTLL